MVFVPSLVCRYDVMWEQQALQVEATRSAALPTRSGRSGHRDGAEGAPECDYLICACVLRGTQPLHSLGGAELLKPNGDPWCVPLYRVNHRQFLGNFPTRFWKYTWLLRCGHVLFGTSPTGSGLRVALQTGEYPADQNLKQDGVVTLCVCGTCTLAPVPEVHQDFRLSRIGILRALNRRRVQRNFVVSHGPGSTHAVQMEARWDKEWRDEFEKVTGVMGFDLFARGWRVLVPDLWEGYLAQGIKGHRPHFAKGLWVWDNLKRALTVLVPGTLRVPESRRAHIHIHTGTGWKKLAVYQAPPR